VADPGFAKGGGWKGEGGGGTIASAERDKKGLG